MKFVFLVRNSPLLNQINIICNTKPIFDSDFNFKRSKIAKIENFEVTEDYIKVNLSIHL